MINLSRNASSDHQVTHPIKNSDNNNSVNVIDNGNLQTKTSSHERVHDNLSIYSSEILSGMEAGEYKILESTKQLKSAHEIAEKLCTLKSPLAFFAFINYEVKRIRNSELFELVNEKLYKNNTVLHYASDMADLDLIGWLVDHGANISAEGEGKMIPLSWFLRSGSINCKEAPDILRKLASDKALFIKKDDVGYPLFTAVTHANRYVIRTILDLDVDLSLTDQWGSSFLFYLLENKNPCVYDEFKNVKFDVNIQDTCGDTALHIASATGNIRAVKFLISKNADLRIKNKKGLTALENAEKEERKGYGVKNRVKCIKLLKGTLQINNT